MKSGSGTQAVSAALVGNSLNNYLIIMTLFCVSIIMQTLFSIPQSSFDIFGLVNVHHKLEPS